LFLSLQLNGASYKAKYTNTPGGVGRNVAECLYKLNGTVSLISAFGNDQNGECLRKMMPSQMTMHSVISNSHETACFAVILDKNGDSKLHVGDMDIHGKITPDLVSVV
jgi:sugar/nucleoside kinase (ribokinase family)